jgi:hypothetical protein
METRPDGFNIRSQDQGCKYLPAIFSFYHIPEALRPKAVKMRNSPFFQAVAVLDISNHL